ncbi:pentapeptide repeat-containing protein [Olleya sp. YSTF-M6]|uniref:Pentapeptide repeat-containing protein n=1 Tax=Olleya sediminilitoris TaxID=2795739 RepID=A0ABS1WL20_9FLAO|nr:pentapeptide repeat-containing protein [Olleya sediminilitoris]MBL7559806.1 pentapeptide repeat-containing protein [Olleya sediminilitoris]
MSAPFIADQDFKNIDFTTTALQKAEYDNCTFINCNLSDCYLSMINFIDCQFIDCNLSNCKTSDTTLNNVKFINCKLLGMLFNDCNQLIMAINFENCQLDFASFYQLKLTNSLFTKCVFNKTEFTEANLSKSIFKDCDFRKAIFFNTNLEEADFTTAYNYIINPENNRIKGAKFSKDQIEGLLEHYKINIS